MIIPASPARYCLVSSVPIMFRQDTSCNESDSNRKGDGNLIAKNKTASKCKRLCLRLTRLVVDDRSSCKYAGRCVLILQRATVREYASYGQAKSLPVGRPRHVAENMKLVQPQALTCYRSHLETFKPTREASQMLCQRRGQAKVLIFRNKNTREGLAPTRESLVRTLNKQRGDT